MRKIVFSTALACGFLAAQAGGANLRGEELRAGASAVAIEADDSMVISGGIGPRYAVGQEGELRAVAVVLGLGREKLALVACDVLFVDRQLLDPVLDRIARSTGIPPSHVLVNATHTHHAPSTTTVHGYARVEVFCERLARGIQRAVETANQRLERGAAKFYFHVGEEKTVGENSRLRLSDGTIFWIGDHSDALGPSGPMDPQLPVLAFRNSAGELLALLYNHSTHPIGTLKGNVRSPSFYGLAAQQLERELGGTVCFLEGASGSTHNLALSTDVALARIKSAVRGTLKQATPRAVARLAAARRPFRYKIRTFDESVEDAKVVAYCRKRSPADADANIEVFRQMRRTLKPSQGQERQTWLQAVLIGDVAVVGVPAEYFTVLGMDVKRRSPFHDTVIVELANDWIGYLPDREAHALGGYQTWMGQHSYAEIGTGERLADAAVALLKELKGGGPKSR